MTKLEQVKISLISLHGLIRAHDPELGRDADTGGQVKYVLELAAELSRHPQVREVELITRQIIDPRVGPEYGIVEEPITERAKIIRIPFGPQRYLRKELLWPYIELFVDQVLAHFKRTGLPDILHGHYADAGLAGAQLARLLHIPYVFTGHSLGRVKRERLSVNAKDLEQLDKKYHFKPRIEAEEIALETATMVVTSTNQEVDAQYAVYDHYVPGRMEVIPPGVDLHLFSPPTEAWETPAIDARIRAFLREPEKPMILAMSRPDERKNIPTLVRVFGESRELRERANLVLILGTRSDLDSLPSSQQDVFLELLTLIDMYDLYGQVAYPKWHSPNEVPDLYRLAVHRRGLFINPALTEPFGLTLLEAAATGLPVVATNDGGPRDILANCQNGLLIDPLDQKNIEKSLLRVLTEPVPWQEWSENGIRGVHQHYTWKQHADRYLRDLADILENSPSPVLCKLSANRRLPSFDRLLITDLDNTLTGDDDALRELVDRVCNLDYVGFGIATGRPLKSALELIESLRLPRPDLIQSDAGTQLHYGKGLAPDVSWQKQIGYAWRPDEVRSILDAQPGLSLQPDEHQSHYKVSYLWDSKNAPSIAKIKKILREAGVRAKVLLSLGMYLDVIPVRGGSDLSLRHVLWKWGFSPENVLVAGDSGNDEGMLTGRTLGVVVSNYSSELERLRNRPRIYFASAPHARGILEGVDYYHFLDQIVIPNDHID
ncbi:Mannosylfructose-phosphate synthase [Pirellula sp. SH-Sr6A]|uniref:HAD-IIB family hydrolase n=1 Tax=Pirellula sp. SH-Sr6A TaxID=1632865 RepID=UPI00078BE37C|nr:HAD-IIB family hydrolase [Pirellula sp. SH-Sr6A]AMV35042.1 Mannosylfructose-phosphate synthase [Pirellula sp. SH-Sr6A]